MTMPGQAEGADRLVERQGQRLGAARGAPRGDYEIVGALTTVTETFGRVTMHGVREALLQAQLAAARLAVDRGAHSRFPARTRSTSAKWRRRWRRPRRAASRT